MARPQNTVVALDKRFRGSIDSARSIFHELCSSLRDPTLNSRVEALIKTLEKVSTVRENLDIQTEYDELDELGVKTWNLATQLSNDDSVCGERSNDHNVILNIRILAFFMLDGAELSSNRSSLSTTRLLKISLKIGKDCADQKQHPWALKIMERAAKYLEDLEKLDGGHSSESGNLFHRLSGEYYTLRMIIAWKQLNLPMAELMYNKAMFANKVLDDASASERLARVIMNIGTSLLSQNAFDSAIKWLRRSLEVLSGVNPLHISDAGTELRYSVMYNLVTGCLHNEAEEDLQYARNALETMLEEWPARFAVHRLKLELISIERPDEIDEHHIALMKIISIAQFNEDVFRTILGRIQKLSDRSVSLACICADELIKRLLVLDEDNWIERAFITRLWMTVRHSTSLEGNTLASLRNLIDCETIKHPIYLDRAHVILEVISRQISKPLSPKSTHAAQILLWKSSEAYLAQEKYAEASAYCEVALHKVFDKKGCLNFAKIERRIIHCAVQDADYGKAAEVYEKMSEEAKQHPSTLFLMFRVALRTSNNQLAESSIRGICEAPLRDHRALYACVLEAHSFGSEVETLRALKHVLRHMDNLPVDSIHKPATLRCAIRLTMAIIDHTKGGEISNIESLCRLLELASEAAKKSKIKKTTSNNQDTAFTVKELEWFSRTSYNLSLRSIEEWHPSMSTRIVSTCIKFLELYPEDIDSPTQHLASLKAAYCHFLSASLKIQLGRGEDHTESRLQCYLDAKWQIQSFRSRRLAIGDNLSQDILWDLKDKYSTLLLYEFEACVHLKDWDRLNDLVGEADHCENARLVQYFGDMILRSQAPSPIIMRLMKKILQELILSPSDEVDVTKLAKCVRCQVQLSLIRDPNITAELIGEVMDWAREYKGIGKYPEEELHWLTVTAWNKAIEFKIGSDDVNYRKFGELAMGTAKLMGRDDGKLLARIQRKYLRDNWE